MEKYKNLVDHVPTFLWLVRFLAIGLLVFMIYWIFSDIEFTPTIMANIPLFYLWHPHMVSSKKITILFMPILLNIVLWYPASKSYLILKSIFFVEFCKYIFIMLGSVFAMTSIILYDWPEYFLSAKISVVIFIFIICIRLMIKQNDIKEFYGSNYHLSLIKKVMLILSIYAFACIMPVVEGYVQDKYIYAENRINGQVFKTEFDGQILGLDISSDGRLAAVVVSSENIGSNIKIFDLSSGEEVAKAHVKNANKAFFAVDNQSLVIIKSNVPGRERRPEILNIATTKIEKTLSDAKELMENVKEEQYYVNKLKFNLSGDLFATQGHGISVWDYTNGELKAFYDLTQETSNLAWLSDREYIVLSKSTRYTTGSEDKNPQRIKIYRDTIAKNGEIKRSLEESLQEDIVKKRDELSHKRLVMQVSAANPYIVVSLSGEPYTGILNYQGYVELWNIRENKKVVSYQGNNKIISAEYRPLDNDIVIFEWRRDNKIEAKVFKVDKRKIKKKIIVPNDDNMYNIRIMKSDNKFILYGNSGRAMRVIILTI